MSAVSNERQLAVYAFMHARRFRLAGYQKAAAAATLVCAAVLVCSSPRFKRMVGRQIADIGRAIPLEMKEVSFLLRFAAVCFSGAVLANAKSETGTLCGSGALLITLIALLKDTD
jgi:hypothetical protein